MTCILCDNPNGEDVEITNKAGIKVTLCICDECLINASNDTFLLINCVQSKIDYITEHLLAVG